jgi:3-phenylpropionate/trans-cinnamate dioxygenase ferredoxin reductase component
MAEHIVVVGAGLAGATAVTELREQGYDGDVTLIGAETHPPYERPPLSKAYLMGNDPFEKAHVHPLEWYAENNVDLRLGTTVESVDLARKKLTLSDGELTYDKLLLATGAQPRTLNLDAGDVPVVTLRTLEDSDRIKKSFGEGKKIVIVGAGWIGLEVASAARMAGTDVTVFETAELPLLAVLGPQVATVFADLHREHGVDLRLSIGVTPADLEGADLIVIGIGAAPTTDLAVAAGLDVDNGILVDEHLVSSDPAVYAVGDVANQLHPTLGRLRVEHWDNAIEQAKVAAHNLAGASEAYDHTPYFFTDQYDLGMEYVGHGAAGDDVVVRGDLDGRVFQAFWVRGGRVAAAMHANDWDAGDAIKAIVGKMVDVDRLADADIPLGEV